MGRVIYAQKNPKKTHDQQLLKSRNYRTCHGYSNASHTAPVMSTTIQSRVCQPKMAILELDGAHLLQARVARVRRKITDESASGTATAGTDVAIDDVRRRESFLPPPSRHLKSIHSVTKRASCTSLSNCICRTGCQRFERFSSVCESREVPFIFDVRDVSLPPRIACAADCGNHERVLASTRGGGFTAIDMRLFQLCLK